VFLYGNQKYISLFESKFRCQSFSLLPSIARIFHEELSLRMNRFSMMTL